VDDAEDPGLTIIVYFVASVVKDVPEAAFHGNKEMLIRVLVLHHIGFFSDAMLLPEV
jgi:hypothetical protein